MTGSQRQKHYRYANPTTKRLEDLYRNSITKLKRSRDFVPVPGLGNTPLTPDQIFSSSGASAEEKRDAAIDYLKQNSAEICNVVKAMRHLELENETDKEVIDKTHHIAHEWLWDNRKHFDKERSKYIQPGSRTPPTAVEYGLDEEVPAKDMYANAEDLRKRLYDLMREIEGISPFDDVLTALCEVDEKLGEVLGKVPEEDGIFEQIQWAHDKTEKYIKYVAGFENGWPELPER